MHYRTADQISCYQDPDLLAQFDELNPEGSHSLKEAPSNNHLNKAAIPRDVVAINRNLNISPENAAKKVSAEEAKNLAIKYKREGNVEEALKWFRLAKTLTINKTNTAIPAKENNLTSRKNETIVSGTKITQSIVSTTNSKQDVKRSNGEFSSLPAACIFYSKILIANIETYIFCS